MPESIPYPGSPSLSAEAREKVLQTFRHTLTLAQSGRNEEALLGCDFILKMDARFAPARRLLDALRGIASGTVVDLSGFQAFAAALPAPAAPAAPAAAAPAAPAPARPAAAPAPAPAPAAPAALDDLSLDDLGPAPASFPAPGPGPASAPPSFAMPPAGPSFSMDEASLPPEAAQPAGQAAAPLDSLGFGEVPDLPPLGAPGFEAPSEPPAFGDPFALPGGEPDAAAPRMPAGPAAPAMPAPTRGAGAPDPRVVQFLKQGDDAMARGAVQEAIDLWSRVFLIDLSNEEASQRIDQAREAQAENGRKIDSLLSEGIQLYDAGDLTGARHRFLDVLAISDGDATARSYLNQIDASLSAGPPVTEPTGPPLSDFGPDELAPPPSAAFPAREQMADMVQPEPEREEEREEPSAPRRTVDVRLLGVAALLVLAAVGAGTWWLLKGRRSAPVAPPPSATRPAPARPSTAAPGDAVAQAQALFEQGKVDEARSLLTSIAPGDPRYPEALALIEKMKSTAPPQPTPQGQSPASLDELRIAGLAAAKASRFIDAVKALDPVAKARPEDTEAVQELARSREQVAAMASAVRSYNEQDYESAIKLLWGLRKTDAKNQDVEEYLFKSYFNQGVQSLQAGNSAAAATAFQEALNLRSGDREAQRHLGFARKYGKGATDLVSRIYVRHLAPRQ